MSAASAPAAGGVAPGANTQHANGAQQDQLQQHSVDLRLPPKQRKQNLGSAGSAQRCLFGGVQWQQHQQQHQQQQQPPQLSSHAKTIAKQSSAAAAAASAIANGVAAYTSLPGRACPDVAAGEAVSAALAAVAAAAAAAEAADKVQRGMGAYGRAAGATLVGLFSRLVGVNTCCCSMDIQCPMPGHGGIVDEAAVDDNDTHEPTEQGPSFVVHGGNRRGVGAATAVVGEEEEEVAAPSRSITHSPGGLNKRPAQAGDGYEGGRAAKAAAIGDDTTLSRAAQSSGP